MKGETFRVGETRTSLRPAGALLSSPSLSHVSVTKPLAATLLILLSKRALPADQSAAASRWQEMTWEVPASVRNTVSPTNTIHTSPISILRLWRRGCCVFYLFIYFFHFEAGFSQLWSKCVRVLTCDHFPRRPPLSVKALKSFLVSSPKAGDPLYAPHQHQKNANQGSADASRLTRSWGEPNTPGETFFSPCDHAAEIFPFLFFRVFIFSFLLPWLCFYARVVGTSLLLLSAPYRRRHAFGFHAVVKEGPAAFSGSTTLLLPSVGTPDRASWRDTWKRFHCRTVSPHCEWIYYFSLFFKERWGHALLASGEHL